MPPIKLRVGSVKIYYASRGAGRPAAWRVRDHFGGRGHTTEKKFARKQAALIYAAERRTLMLNGATAKDRISDADAWETEKAKEVLAPIGKTVLEVAYEARARHDLETKQRLAETLPVPAVIEQFLAEKKRQDLSPYHLRDLRIRLGKFASAFQVPINRVTRGEIETWLGALTVSGRTWNNYRAVLVELFTFAKHRKFLPADWTELDQFKPIKLRRGQVRIFTPVEIRALLNGASERLLPAIAIAAFAGLRSEEIQRLKWSDIKWDEGYIFLRAEITKTNRERTVPILEALASYRSSWENRTGKVCDYKNLSVGKCNLARRAGLKWSRNVLRQSFISYRLGAIKNVSQVAAEAGNSERMIHRHYLDLTTPAQAEIWFGIRAPTVPQNILQPDFMAVLLGK